MKKVLSFVLSVAMVICMMPVMAFAAEDAAAAPTTTETTQPADNAAQPTDNAAEPAETATGLSQFSDADSIVNENKMAVAVLVGLGIIDGMGDGTFQPEGNLTRAQASKLVATLAKSGDKSDIPAPAEAPFTDVAKDYWGAGAIQFGVENGYINGMGDGTFHPEDQVTTAQLATMLLKLLGYSVEDVNYHWPENAMGLGNTAGLFYSVNKVAEQNLNRQEAAQMMFNGLIADTVMKSSVSGSNTSDVDGHTNYVPVYNKVAQDCGFHRIYNATDENGMPAFNVQQLIEKYFPKATYIENRDAFGRPSTVWKNGKEDMTDDVIKAPVYSYDSRQVDSLTNKFPAGVATSQLKEDLQGYEAENASVVINAEVQDEVITEDFSEYLANLIAPMTGNGVLVELYANEKDTHITDVIVIDYDVDMVSKVSSKTGDITLKDNGVIDKKEDYYAGISTVAKGDFILVATLGDEPGEEIIDAYMPTVVEGVAVTKLTSVSKPGREDAVATIGGTDYSLGHDSIVYENPYGELSAGLRVNAEDFGTAYLDKYKNVVAYSAVKLPDWALLKSVYSVTSYNELGEASTAWYGLIVKEDGTKDNVRLLYITDDEEPGYNTPAAVSTRNIINSFRRTAVQDGNNWFSQEGVLVNYIETAAGYRLSKTNGASVGVDNPNTTIGTSYNGGTKAIDGYYPADEITVITPTGRKASTLQIKTTNEIEKTFLPGSYKFVAKRINDNKNYVVTTIYITNVAPNDTNVVVKVSKVLSSSASGSEVRYYTDDSAEPSEIVVANDSVQPGFYYVEQIAEGMFLDSNRAINVFDRTMVAGDNVSGIKSSLQLYDENYTLAKDATVVDLAESEITTVDDLVGAIAEIGEAAAGSADVSPLHISFAYDVADDGARTIKQVYIEK
jgi:hypothetical protein